ncbi:MAG: NlpC/P60 family protein [Acidimicrobiia bacterium]|nr:NlpC/P60 family protein [Acidimicrobiia bacterium]
MRNIGDHNWLNNYVGKSYELGGRGPDAVDCYGLCVMIYRDMFNIELPDWRKDFSDLRERGLHINDIISSGDWITLNEPVDGCFVVCKGHRLAHHIGLFFAGGVIHAYNGIGVIYEPMHRFYMRFPSITFGEWRPCVS